jgi:hypothetical protein
MLKSITCAALAALSICSFAQMESKNGIYYSDVDLMANPPTAQKNTVSYADMRWNVIHQTAWINGADRYDFLSMLDNSTGNIQNSLLQALYNARCEANLARRDVIAAEVANADQMANSPAPGYTYFFAQTFPTMSAQMAPTDFTDVDNRPMRMVLDQPRVPNINYWDACDILEHELNTGAAVAFDNWYWNDASDRDRDVLVRMLKQDAWIKNQPIYVSTMTKRAF